MLLYSYECCKCGKNFNVMSFGGKVIVDEPDVDFEVDKFEELKCPYCGAKYDDLSCTYDEAMDTWQDDYNYEED